MHFQKITLQDAAHKAHPGINRGKGVVHHYRSQGCLFSHPYLPGTLEVPTLCLQASEFKVPFGLSLSPRVFTRVVTAALMPIQRAGLKIMLYLDDWLVCAPSRQQVVQSCTTFSLLASRSTQRRATSSQGSRQSF